MSKLDICLDLTITCMVDLEDTIQIVQSLVDADHQHKEVLSLILSALKIAHAHADKLKPARQSTLQTLLRELRLTVQHVSTRPRLHAWVHNAGFELSSLLYRIQHFLKPLLHEVASECSSVVLHGDHTLHSCTGVEGACQAADDSSVHDEDTSSTDFSLHDSVPRRLRDSHDSHNMTVIEYVEQCRFRQDVRCVRTLIDIRVALLRIRAEYNAFVQLHDHLKQMIDALEAFEQARALDVPQETIPCLLRDRVGPMLLGLRSAVLRSLIHLTEYEHQTLQHVLNCGDTIVHSPDPPAISFRPFRETLAWLKNKTACEPLYVEHVQDQWDECARQGIVYFQDAQLCTTWQDVWDRVNSALHDRLLCMNEDVRRTALRTDSAVDMKCSHSTESNNFDIL